MSTAEGFIFSYCYTFHFCSVQTTRYLIMADSTIGRLPMNTRPIHYILTLEPDLERFDFQGEVKVWYGHLDPQEGKQADLTNSGSIS